MRVLILAEDCNPDMLSVPAFSYHAVRAIADHADVVLATQIRNWGSLEKAGLGGAKVVPINTERVAKPLWQLGLFLRGGSQTGWLTADILSYPSQLAFEVMVAKRFYRELHNGKFDVVHRLSPWPGSTPSFMASACPVPFLLGPLNDNLPWPEMSTDVMNREIMGVDRIASRFLWLLRRLPYQRSKYRNAQGILACYSHTIAALPRSVRRKTINFPEVGIDPTVFNLSERPHREQKTVLFVGRLTPLKLPEVVVHAFAASEILRQHRLLIIGDGPERPLLEKLIAQYNLGASVQLLGWKTNKEVGELMSQADIFAFPSVHEMGGAVVIEAMASGMVPVVIDHGGPATLVGDFGVKIAPGTIAQLTTAFKTELEQLVGDDQKLRRLGAAAHRHAMTYYTWDVKARKTVEIYRWLTGQIKYKPNFWQAPASE